MTNKVDHIMARQALPGKTRQVALAASVALVAVTGTATIAWSALSLALAPAPSVAATQPAEPAPQVRTADMRGFAAATRDLATTPVASPESRDVVVLSSQSREEQRLGNAVQPKLFGGAAAPARNAPVARPAIVTPVEEARTLRPVARPAPTVAADPAPVTVAAASPDLRTAPLSRPGDAAGRGEDKTRLHRLWSVGLFR